MFTIFAFALVGVVAIALVSCIGGGSGGGEAQARARRDRMMAARSAAQRGNAVTPIVSDQVGQASPGAASTAERRAA